MTVPLRDVPRLKPELARFSLKPRTLNVTVVTAFSTDRLHMLSGMCDSWRGPLSAAVYQGTAAGSKSAFFEIQRARAMVREIYERCGSARYHCLSS